MNGPATNPSLDCLLRITIPGDPVAQGRGRAVRFGDSARVIDPERSVTWKAKASYYMGRAMAEAGIPAPFARPLFVRVDCYFKCPKGKPSTVVRWRPQLPDADNVAKAALDAAKGVAWLDDRQVVHLDVRKFIAPTGVGPCVVVTLADIGEAA